MKSIIGSLVMFLLEHADFAIAATAVKPEGAHAFAKPHDIPELQDKYLVLTVGEAGHDFVGYWQYQ